MRKFIPFSMMFFLFCHIPVFGNASAEMSVTAVGTCDRTTIDKHDLIAGAGSDLKSTYTSASDQVLLSVSGSKGASDAWQVDIRRQDNNWDPRLKLSARRTNDGKGRQVSSGRSYHEVTNHNSAFFSGAGDVRDVKIRLKLSGVSVKIPPSSYSTMVYYTVRDLADVIK
ncbi:MAG: hypothetical protein B6245_22980 [Desulfobacteraceae bacterium 4572_88]|nr:MAG: hypothetical protein B6245_22980 [Desulfobacteraceae bacterium 4572_88]